MHNQKTLRVLSIVVLVAIVGGLAACGATATPTAAPTKAAQPTVAATTAPAQPTVAATKAPTAAPTAAPSGPTGKLVIGSAIDANSFNPTGITVTDPEQDVLDQVIDSLIWRANDMTLHPGLAESWKQIDATTWEFKLRKGVKYTNGETFTAANVKYSIDRILDPATKAVEYAVGTTGVTGVEVIDDFTCRIKLKAPTAGFLARMWTMPVLPINYYKTATAEQIATKPIGSGPYKFVEWVKNDHITIEANPDYWGEKPKIKTVIYRIIPDASTRIAELKAGSIDIAAGIPVDQLKSVETDTTTVMGIETGGRASINFHFIADKPWMNLKVRQALAYAIDYDTIIKALLGGYGTHRFNITAKAETDPSLTPWPYDATKAKALLAEAGFANGFEIDLDCRNISPDKDIMQAIADYWAKVGVKAKVIPSDPSAYTPKMLNKQMGGAYYLAHASIMDGLSDMNRLARWDSYNPMEWNNTAYEDALKAAFSEVDAAKQQALKYKAQKVAYDDLPWITLWNTYSFTGVSKKVVGFTPRADGRIMAVGVSMK